MSLRIAAFAALALALAGCAGTPSGGRRAYDGPVIARAVDGRAAAAAISAYRASRGLGPVTVDGVLTAAAQEQAKAVAAAGQLSHGDFGGRMTAYGVRGEAAENLSMGPTSVAEAIARWKASPGHDANLLMAPATRIGLARADAGRPYWALVLAR